MRILYVSHLHPPVKEPLDNIGGMQRVSTQLLRQFQKCEQVKIKAEVLHAPWDKISIHVGMFLLKLLFSLPRKVKKFDADVILFSSMVTASLAWLLRKKINIPMISITHGRDVIFPFCPYQMYIPKIFDALDGVISVSGATKKECIKRGLPPEKSVVIGNGYSTEFSHKLPSRKQAVNFLEKLLGIELAGKFILLTVGRNVERKGHAWFLKEVFPKLNNDVIYVSIGGGPEQENLKRIQQHFDSNVSNRIFLLGKQADEVLWNSYKAADIFVMPNIPVEGDMEGFGIVILEANLASTPVIASDIDGIKDVIKNGINGYLIPALNADLYIRKITELQQQQTRELAESSYRYVLENFSWEKISEKYLKYLGNKIV